MICEKCSGPTRMQVQAVISAPGTMYHQFSKKNLFKKEVHLMGVLWETADFICDDPKCQHVSRGYGNYVTNLKQEVEDLKIKIASKESSWINIDEQTPQELGILEVVVRLTDGSELHCWAQSDGDFWWKPRDAFIYKTEITEWRPQNEQGNL